MFKKLSHLLLLAAAAISGHGMALYQMFIGSIALMEVVLVTVSGFYVLEALIFYNLNPKNLPSALLDLTFRRRTTLTKCWQSHMALVERTGGLNDICWRIMPILTTMLPVFYADILGVTKPLAAFVTFATYFWLCGFIKPLAQVRTDKLVVLAYELIKSRQQVATVVIEPQPTKRDEEIPAKPFGKTEVLVPAQKSEDATHHREPVRRKPAGAEATEKDKPQVPIPMQATAKQTGGSASGSGWSAKLEAIRGQVPSQELLDKMVPLLQNGEVSGVAEKMATVLTSGRYGDWRRLFAPQGEFWANEDHLSALAVALEAAEVKKKEVAA